MIILMSGKIGSGKSRMAAELCKLLPNSCIVKFADPLYAIHNTVMDTLRYYGYPVQPNSINRDLLQDIGLWGRKQDAAMWVKLARGRINRIMLENPKAVVLVDDLRYPNEFMAFGDAFTIRLKASEECRKRRAEKLGNFYHESELALDSMPDSLFDIVCDTEHYSLEENVGRILQALHAKTNK